MRKATAVVLLAATVGVPTTSAAHHRTSDYWERRYDHHHGHWAYRASPSLGQHRRWHRWNAEHGGGTSAGHRKGPVFRVESTAYCLRGRMANGQYAHTGAIAMNNVPLGTRYVMTRGPYEDKIFTVKDRIGSGSEVDIAMPGRCTAARRYGRRMVHIRRVAS